MRGYVIQSGFMGYIDGHYQLFETEDEYVAYFREQS